MTSTFTPLEIMPSASVENFCSSPCAFWMSASRPSACIAAVSSGLSKPSHRAELWVSGRITPTLTPLAAGAELCAPPPLLLGAAAFWPQAARTIVRPSPAVSTAALLVAVVLVRIRRPLPPRWGPRRGRMLWRATYVAHGRGANHTEPFKSPRCITIGYRAPEFVATAREHPSQVPVECYA